MKLPLVLFKIDDSIWIKKKKQIKGIFKIKISTIPILKITEEQNRD